MASKRSALAALIAGAAICAAAALALPVRAESTPPLAVPLATQENPMTVVLDARKAPLGLAYAHMTIPVSPGPFTIDYPEWIPGEHGPSGPLAGMAQLRVSANGVALPYARDQVDLYAFHIVVPQNVSTIDVDFTVILNTDAGRMSTPNVMVGNWNRSILYQRGVDNEHYFVRASLIVPPGWDFASALPVTSRTGDRVDFGTVSLETLVDSPTDIGRYVKHITTYTGDGFSTYLDLFADAPEDLKIDPKLVLAYQRLTPEAIALYGGRHFDTYHAELTLSDALGFQGIEHHQSSDDRATDAFLSDAANQVANGDLVPHEFSHSWNGKYRRPFDLQQPDFNDPFPERTELLWQYEGMNQYVGDMLSFRTGIRDPKAYPEYLAATYAEFAFEPGRATTPIIDVTTGAPYYYCCARGVYPSIRRTADDFYGEGELIWLDADTIIRERSHGKKSLDDYMKLFAGGVSGPKVVTYTRLQLESYLEQVEPYDWHAFFDKYVYSIAPVPPTDEIERAGYKLVYNDTPNVYDAGREAGDHPVVSWFDVGARLSEKGAVTDVREDSPAWKGGLAPGMQVVAVDDRAFTADLWYAAIANAKSTTEPIHLRVKTGSWYEKIDVDYHDGAKYPHLERISGTVDMLAEIMRAHAP
jgi:predicted metalloprotease with PDZ domain